MINVSIIIDQILRNARLDLQRGAKHLCVARGNHGTKVLLGEAKEQLTNTTWKIKDTIQETRHIRNVLCEWIISAFLLPWLFYHYKQQCKARLLTD